MKVHQRKTLRKWKGIRQNLVDIRLKGLGWCGYCEHFALCSQCPLSSGTCKGEESLHSQAMNAVMQATFKVDILIEAIEESIRKEAEDAG